MVVENNGTETEWRVGEKVPVVKLSDLFMIQADGPELDYIRALFTHQVVLNAPTGQEPATIKVDVPSLPWPNKRVCRWTGDAATMVLLNI